jgi:di/tricarboxylate transporter
LTIEILIVFSVILIAIILFVTDKVRIDLVALFVLVTLAITNTISPQEAISGFSNPAVITIWAMYILSAGLTRTNVAGLIGRRVLRISGSKEKNILLSIMLASGFLSVFMNNIGVAALMLPVVMSISRKTKIAPSKLLMPMVIGLLLGGMTTLLTTNNLLVSDFLLKHNYKPFDLYDFFPVGIFIFIAGIIYILYFGIKLLPAKDPVSDITRGKKDLKEQYALLEKTYILEINEGSIFSGKSLSEIKLGSAVGLTVFGIIHNGSVNIAPDGNTPVFEKDKLLVGGRMDRFKKLQSWQDLVIYEENPGIEKLISDEILIKEVKLAEDASIEDLTLNQSGISNEYNINVLAIKNDGIIRRLNLRSAVLHAGSTMLVQGSKEQLESMENDSDFEYLKEISKEEITEKYKIQEKIFSVSVLERSDLNGKSLSESKIGSLLGLRILGIIRDGNIELLPSPGFITKGGDILIAEGEKIDVDLLKGYQELKIISETTPELKELESDKISFAEAVLAPRSQVAGKTLRALNFREKYGLQVISIWREGKSYVSNLRDLELQFGDAILLLGKKENINLLGRDPDFILLTKIIEEKVNAKKAPLSISILLLMLLLVLFGILPISIAALSAAVLMVFTGCLSMDEAYRSIEWRSVFLIAGMLPVGIAMQNTGAINLVSSNIILTYEIIGPWGVIILLYIISTIACSFIPSAALVVIMAPIALNISTQVGISPYTVMMALAVSANASFLSPVSHAANVLIMGPGGYKMKDYLKVGLPLTLIVMVIGLIAISIFWPI